MDAIELHRLSQTIIVNLALDADYGVSAAVNGDDCVWTCASGSLETVSGLIVDYDYINTDPNFILQE